MNLEAFQQNVREKETYETDPAWPRSVMGRLLGWCRLHFYLRLASIVHWGHKCALKGEYDKEHWARNSYMVWQLVQDCGVKIKVSGLQNLKKLDGAPVCISNHMSLLETLLLPAIVLEHYWWSPILKGSLLEYPWLKGVLNAVGPIVVGRSDPRADLKTVLSEGCAKLTKGDLVMVFPQATRSVEFKPKEFNTLGIKLAKRAGVQVLPLALKTDFVRPGKLKVFRDLGPLDRSKTIHFEFGEPIRISGNGKAEHEKVLEFVGGCLTRWKEEEN
jgi:1-acyl-sn-glycerol-3-phosphate acyltransferase